MKENDIDVLYDFKMVLYRLELMQLGYGEIVSQMVREHVKQICGKPYWVSGENE